jgi:threonine dehydrogenase-like Zn-dependent dehydrogenase
VIGIDPVPERRAMAVRYGIEAVDSTGIDDVPAAVLGITAGYGAHGVIDAVGMDAHGGVGATVGKMAQAPRDYCRMRRRTSSSRTSVSTG